MESDNVRAIVVGGGVFVVGDHLRRSFVRPQRSSISLKITLVYFHDRIRTFCPPGNTIEHFLHDPIRTFCPAENAPQKNILEHLLDPIRILCSKNALEHFLHDPTRTLCPSENALELHLHDPIRTSCPSESHINPIISLR